MGFQPACAPVSGVPAQVYVAAAVGTPSISIFNNGTQPAYIGGSSVTAATGFLLPPQTNIDFPSYPQGVWAVANPGTLGTSTTIAALATAGAGTITCASVSGYTAGQTIIIGTGAAAEPATIGSVNSAGTSLVLAAGTRWAHGTAETLALMSAPLGTSLNVLAGVR
jgi:hypothetical protein